MSESAKDKSLALQLTVEELSSVVESAVKAAMRSAPKDGDRLLDPAEAAKLLSVSEEYLYRHRKTLPFARKLGPRLLRFSYQGLLKWAEAKKFERS